ncbi:hypothetical protein TD95_004924 [Thielaviopsis punctulata]|uniref:C2H2-type domain-containing protein n=1 Tax=Thielaviopsis punctulata TaxID=72032 RepID=A0A0F4Z9Z8_9PEZI|nr:hypothetical protein TD95_004924 [Thielaviopsis punctulata]
MVKMPGASTATLPAVATATASASSPATKKATAANAPERKYKCQFCNRAFSRSEHRSRHERSHTKERPFKCLKCRSTFVRRDLLLRHDRTVHAKDGGVPLHSDGKRRAGPKSRAAATSAPAKTPMAIDHGALEQIEASSDNVFDIEAAAMLVADMQQKAMRDSAGPYDNGNAMDIDYAPRASSATPAVEHTVTYPNGAIGLAPQQQSTSSGQIPPWEFLPQNVRQQHKAHSVASTAASYDSLASTSAPHAHSHGPALNPLQRHSQAHSYAHAHTQQHRLPPLNGLVPALQSMISALSPSEAPTSAPQTPMDMPATLATLNPPSAVKMPVVSSEEERNVILDAIRSIDTEHAIPEGFHLPGLSALNRYLSTYFGLFHQHLPFLHVPSFAASPSSVAPALMLSVLSIGALYSFDQDEAYLMHIGSKILVNQFLQHKENFSSRKCPLWTMQSSLLNMVFASLSGDAKGLEWTCSIKSLLANMVAGNRYELKLRQEARGRTPPSRAEWIEDEGCRRTYYAVYIFFGLLTMTFNHTPAIALHEFEELQLPSTETEWNMAVNVGEINGHSSSWTPPVAPTFMESYVHLVQGEPTRYSAFAARALVTALFLEVWSFKRSPRPLQDSSTAARLRTALAAWAQSLPLCVPEAGCPVPSANPGPNHALLFNAQAVYRNALCRLEVDLKAVQEALRYHDSYEVAAAMSNSCDSISRTPAMLAVIEQCYATLELCVSHGLRWVARTAPTNWSVEHPLAALDMLIILTMWLYRLEHDGDHEAAATTAGEMAMYHRIRDLLERECSERHLTQLSAAVAHLWASMLDEVVVWGITRLVGEAFRLHSQALSGCVEEAEAGSCVSTPSMISQGGDEDSVY